jgi:hypothetical protein
LNMRKLFINLVLGLLVLGAGPEALLAQEAAPSVFEQKLKAYDPDAVAAARDYAQTMNFKEMMEKAVPGLSLAVTKQIKAKNPELKDEQVSSFVDAFLKSALVDSAPVLEQTSILMALDIFNKDELIALSKF